MDRRSFIKCAALPPLMLSHRTSWAGLADPDKDALSLEAQKTTWEIFKDKPATHIWSFDNNIFAKPIYAKQGEEVVIKVQNHLMENLGVHWHGIRLPNRMDGVPYLTQKPIMSKTGNFVYRFIANDAGTYWYHTHLNSMEQLERGLLGPLIIKEEKDYPVDEDWVMVLKDWRLTRAYQIDNRFYNRHDMVHNGRYGNVLTVNGKYVPTQEARPNARVRLRLINASNARIFVVDLSAFSQKTLVAIDGHPIIPRPYTSTYLAPGMRLDVIIDLIDKAKNYQILDQFDQPIKLFNVHLKNKPQRQKALSSKRIALPQNPVAQPNLDQAIEHTISLRGGAMSSGLTQNMMQQGLFWTINGKALKEDKRDKPVLLSLKQGRSYILTVINHTRFPHPMHLHGHTFKVLDADPPYWSDTLFLLPDQTMKVALVADNPGLWMLHCHVLDHLAAGMMGVVEVA